MDIEDEKEKEAARVSEDDNYPGGWFGESWGAPVCEPRRHMLTPVGESCAQCGREIGVDDQGMVIPCMATVPAALSSFHLACFLQSIVGPTPKSSVKADDECSCISPGVSCWYCTHGDHSMCSATSHRSGPTHCERRLAKP